MTCGATEAMIATLLAVINPGDEVIIFEPFYENYGPDVILAGAAARYVTLRDPDFSIDRRNSRPRSVGAPRRSSINTPHNPTGKVFTRAELEMIAALCHAITTRSRSPTKSTSTSSMAAHITCRIASLPGMADRTITISGLSKTYSITGWRLAYTVACERLTSAIRKVHDFLTVGAPHPLQEAGAAALRVAGMFYADLTTMYERKRAHSPRRINSAGPQMPQARRRVLHHRGYRRLGIQR